MSYVEFPGIETSATGRRIELLMKSKGICVKDIQGYLGLSAPQAVYKWLRGEGLPSIDNLFALSRLLDVTVDDILVQEEPRGSSCYFATLHKQMNCQTVNYYYLHIQAA